MGPFGGLCPWDACGWAYDYEEEGGSSDLEDGQRLMTEDAQREADREDEDDHLPF